MKERDSTWIEPASKEIYGFVHPYLEALPFTIILRIGPDNSQKLVPGVNLFDVQPNKSNKMIPIS